MIVSTILFVKADKPKNEFCQNEKSENEFWFVKIRLITKKKNLKVDAMYKIVMHKPIAKLV